MFDERRQRSTGIDKSYPLKPISLGTSANSESRTIKTFNTQKQISTTIKQMNCSTSNINTNNNSDLLQYDDDIQNETFPTGILLLFYLLFSVVFLTKTTIFLKLKLKIFNVHYTFSLPLYTKN